MCQLRSLCPNRGVMLPCAPCTGVPMPPSPLEQDGPWHFQHSLCCPCLHSLSASSNNSPLMGSSIPCPSLASLHPYLEQRCALAPASLESLSVDCLQDTSRSTWTRERTHSQGPAAGSVQAQGCMSSLGGLCGGSSSSSHPPTNGSEILGQ